MKRKGRTTKSAVCPTPKKIALKDRSAARAALKVAKGKGGHVPTRFYLCQCGRFHLTSKKPNEI